MKKKIIFILTLFTLTFTTTFLSATFAMSYGDEYPEVYDLRWSNRTAKWSVDGYADKYEIRLYRDDRRVFTKTVSSRSKNLASEMSRGNHEYYFEVRPFNYETGWGEWQESDSIYVRKASNYTDYDYGSNYIAESPYDLIGTYNGNQNYTPTTPTYPGYGPGEIPSTPTPQTLYNPAGQWVLQGGVWRYMYQNGVFATNSWLLLDNKWYYIDVNTNMVTGLRTIGQSTYFFNTDGSMVIGTVIINGISHYFDGNGKMVY